MAGSVWLRAPRPTTERKLSRDRLVAATVVLLDRTGLDAVTMRAVAAELAVTVGALYWHVAGRDELLELALDEVLGDLLDDAGPPDGWREALAAAAHRQRGVLLAHPWVIPLLGRLPNVGPNAVTAAESVLGIATRAGFTAPAHVLAALHDHVVGATVGQCAWRDAVARHSEDDRPAAHLAEAARRHPNLAAAIVPAATADVGAECDRRFTFGLECLLDGLAARLSGG